MRTPCSAKARNEAPVTRSRGQMAMAGCKLVRHMNLNNSDRSISSRNERGIYGQEMDREYTSQMKNCPKLFNGFNSFLLPLSVVYPACLPEKKKKKKKKECCVAVVLWLVI